MKHTNLKKKSHRLRPQQLVIQFTDRFQSLFQTLIIAHPLLDLRALLPTNAELPRLPTRVGYREHPDRMSSSGPALRTIRHARGCSKCRAGGGHPVWVLTVTYPGGKTRQFSIRREQRTQVQQWVRNYQRLKEGLEAISELNHELLRP